MLVTPTRHPVTLSPVPLSPLRAEAPAWRVLSSGGRLIGYIDAHAASEGLRYRASRMAGAGLRKQPIGEFWQLDAALESFIDA